MVYPVYVQTVVEGRLRVFLPTHMVTTIRTVVQNRIQFFQGSFAVLMLLSRGNSLSDGLDLSSVLGDTRAYLYSPVLG